MRFVLGFRPGDRSVGGSNRGWEAGFSALRGIKKTQAKHNWPEQLPGPEPSLVKIFKLIVDKL